MTEFVGVVGGAMGSDPFDRKSWSGCSFPFFTELQRQGALRTAFGVKLTKPALGYYALKNFTQPRAAWRARLYIDVSYREALTRRLRSQLQDVRSPILQLGTYFSSHEASGGSLPMFGYTDSTLAIRLQSPVPLPGAKDRLVAEALDYDRRIAKQFTRMFVMSEDVRQSYIHDYGASPDRVTTIGCGFNLSKTPSEQPDKDFNSKEILFIATKFIVKGGLVLLQAFSQVRARHPEAILHVVGGPASELPSPLPKGVVNHGYLPRGGEVLTGLYERCSVFTLPSLYEGVGISAVEAMVYQIPTVVSGAFGMADTVLDGQTGLWVKIGDPDDLAEKINTLLDDPQLAGQLGRAGRERALSTFTWDAVVKRLLEASRQT